MDTATVTLALTTDSLLARLAYHLYHPTPVSHALLVAAAADATRQVQPILAAAGLQSELPGQQHEATPTPHGRFCLCEICRPSDTAPLGPLHRRMAGLPPGPAPEGELARRLGK